MGKMVMAEKAKITAGKCRHYAMCKIDFLGLGLCPAGKEKHFVSYYPQGRMDLYRFLAEDLIPVTQGLVDIAETCTLCGICDKQCHFVTELRPLTVMKALKDYVDAYLQEQGELAQMEEDAIMSGLMEILGPQYVSNDPAVLATYADDPCPVTELKMPRYVALPATQREVKEIVTLCNTHNLPYSVRGNGSSVIGIVMSDGLVMDMCRLKEISLDSDNWRVDVGAGVSAFDLQTYVHQFGFRVNTAEPSALICANLMCTGILSTFSHAYGTGADNYIDAQFVSHQGESFDLNTLSAPNLFAFKKEGGTSPGICTGTSLKLHPITPDETGLLVPFKNFEEALSFTRELSLRRIGLSVSLLGGEYISTFVSPTVALGGLTKTLFEDTLGIRFLVLVIGDEYAADAVKKMSTCVIDNELLRLLILGLPNLVGADWQELLHDLRGHGELYEILCKPELFPLLATVLNAGPGNIGNVVPEELREFYVELYSQPEMTDIVWLNTFRILSSRMGREKHVLAFIGYAPLDRPGLISDLLSEFKTIADKYGLKNDFGFLTPLDFGKRAILEFDYYADHTDPEETGRMRLALAEAWKMADEKSINIKGLQWINTILFQGFARKENFLYT